MRVMNRRKSQSWLETEVPLAMTEPEKRTDRDRPETISKTLGRRAKGAVRENRIYLFLINPFSQPSEK